MDDYSNISTRTSYYQQPDDSNRARILLVLMWKHYTVRKEKFFMTTMEFLSPIVFFVLLYLIKDIMEDDKTEETSMDSLPEPISIYELPTPLFILYHPQTNLTDVLMTRVGNSLGLKRLLNYSGQTSGYFGSNDWNFITEQFKHFSKKIHAFVLFQDMYGVNLPSNLNYTIRMNVDFQTRSYRSALGERDPHPTFFTEYDTFVRLQWAIDFSFLELQTGNPITQSVYIQEFPNFTKLSSKSPQITGFLITLMYLAICLSLVLTFEFLMSRLLGQRESGIQELIQMVGVTHRILGLSHFLNVLPGGIIFSVAGALFLTAGNSPLLEYSSGFLVGVFLFLHFVSIVAMAFVCSFITSNNEHTMSLATLVYFTSMIPSFIIDSQIEYDAQSDISMPVVSLTGIFPFVPCLWFYNNVMFLEITHQGITFDTLMIAHAPLVCSVAWAYVFLFLQSFLFFTMAYYMSLVRPGKYGTALPWNFFCRKDFWCLMPERRLSTLEIEAQRHMESDYFEPHAPHREIGIDIQHVTKVYNDFVALNHVTLPVLKEQITVLLGHNGAGKTTLMSIVTGSTSATSGKVYVNGLDTVVYQNQVRSQLGFCPQHNLFFSELTVLQHVRFFSMIKGTMTWSEAHESSLELLKTLGLENNAKSLTNKLSGGMKRRLQLACALAGDASVLVLDEPTAGLDVETRRSLWDLLLSLREGRTVLLSTHFMEEADALGDRITALHSGTLRCDATPMFLKKQIDTGYNLSIILKPTATQASIDQISAIITTAIPQATQVAASGNQTLTYKLPSRECDKFPNMFLMLEENKETVDIDSMSVDVSTLEEVFLKLCSDVTVLEDGVDDTLNDDRIYHSCTGTQLMKQQFSALFVRQLRYVKSSCLLFTMMQVILPIMLLMALNFLYNGDLKSNSNPSLEMNLNVYKDKADRRVLSNFQKPLDNRASCCGITYIHSNNINHTLVHISKLDENEYYTYLIGVTLNDIQAVAHYTTSFRHALPVSLNALSNAVAAASSSPRDTPRITTFNHPLQGAAKLNSTVNPKSSEDVSVWAVITTFIIQTTLVSVLVLPGIERHFSTRLIHLMTGCSPEIYWMTTLLHHVLYSILVLVIPTVIFAATIDKEETLTHPSFLGPLAVLLVGGCLSSIALAFLFSFMMPYKQAATALLAFYFIFTFIFPFTRMACQLIDASSANGLCHVVDPVLDTLNYIVTPNTFIIAMLKIGNVARINAYCYLNRHLCPNLSLGTPEDIRKCCILEELPRCHFCFESYSSFPFVIALYTQFVILMVLVILTERGIFNRFYNNLMSYRYKAKEQEKEEELEKEQEYVEGSLKNPRGDVMLVSSVHKLYPRICRKSKVAVRGISFAVREGECFGLVGVNGAGKSSTFKMMTCATFPTRGVIVVNGHHQEILDNSQYRRQLGYCPQFHGMDKFLTGRQNLELLFVLHGMDKKDAQAEAVRWLELIDLTKYADRPVSDYSGGCSRRLSSVAALARRAALSLLDEPTAGVDVAARRQLWRAVRAAQAQTTLAGRKRAVLITSHRLF
ncbi:ATP-binding cassette sub-family A member 2-like isoform X2 [Plodia interpunctella]|uniref:ATP-binding cassette sub-family A member 2-like isoform X2 n=1 Tax=Plodia interpunctella TaxID=58824 RepID=UPI0023675383|nr:ATP-binding cassette sub-family A member 2-like isoform X2 [Plodia interpunctella]